MVSSFYCMPLGFPSGVEEFYVFNRRSVPRPILAHAIRLQLTRKALVQSNQTIFVVNVEAAQFRVFLDVPAMDGYTVR